MLHSQVARIAARIGMLARSEIHRHEENRASPYEGESGFLTQMAGLTRLDIHHILFINNKL